MCSSHLTMSSNNQGTATPDSDLLARWPLPTPDQAKDELLGEAIRNMKLTGYRNLGFAIVRGVLDTDSQHAWDRCVTRIRQNALAYLSYRRELLAPFLDFPVLEQQQADSSTAAASIGLDEAREVFARWRAQHVSTTDARSMLPRFNYFLYVDKACLDSLVQCETWEMQNPEIADLWTQGPPCYVTLVQAELPPFVEEDLASIRRRAEVIAAANPHLADTVMQTVATVAAERAERAARGGSIGLGGSGEGAEPVTISVEGDEGEGEDEGDSGSLYSDPEMFNVQLNVLLELYDRLHDRSSWDLWCVRPPGVFRG